MTDPRGVHATHLDAATIAAFVDRTLDPAARAAAEAHLAACADCREVWVETSEMASETEAGAGAASAPTASPAPRARSRRWIYGGAGLAIAASMVLAAGLLRPASEKQAIEETMEAFVEDVGTHRFTTGRLSQPFAWGPPPSPQRSGDIGALPLTAHRRSLQLQEFAEVERSAVTLHAAGIGLLAAGHFDDAIARLSESTRLDPSRLEAHIDLGAALIERMRRDNDTTEAINAVDATRRALEIAPDAPAARFNYALALELIGLHAESIRAWQAYLAVDDDSRWAVEAREHLQALEADDQGTRQSHSDLYGDIERRLLVEWARGFRVGRAPALTYVGGAEHFDPWLAHILRQAQERPSPCLASALESTSAWQAAFESGQSEKALVYADQAVDSFRCAGLPEADAQSRRAVALFELGRSQAAAEAVSATTRVPVARFPRSHARALQIQGLLEFQRGRFGSSNGYLIAAIAAAEAALDVEFAVALRTLLASLYDEQGDLRSSWREARHALRSVHQIASARRRYAVLASAADRAQSFGLQGAALAFSDALLESTQEWENTLGRAFALLHRAEAYERLAQPSRARSDLKASRKLAALITSDAVHRDLVRRLLFTESLIEPNPQVAIASLTEALEGYRSVADPAFSAPLLLTRGRAFRSMGDLVRAEQDWLRAVETLEAIRTGVSDPMLRISRQDRMWDLYDELVRANRASPARALEFAERGRTRQLLDTLTANNAPGFASSSELVAQLPRRTEAVAFAVLEDELFVWHVRPIGVALEVHPLGRDRLAAMVEEFRRALRERGSASSAELFRLLLPSSLRLESIGTLAFAPDGPLHSFPFGALRESEQSPYLVERVTPLVLPSLTAALHTPPPLLTTGARAVLVGVGNAPPASGLPNLPGVQPEVRSIAGHYPGARLLEEQAATPDVVRKALSAADVFHFAGHAMVDRRFPDRSRLILAQGSNQDSLSMLDIGRAQLPRGATVVLGACETAAGMISRSEGAAAISRAFLSAGAAFVVGTLWPVNDREASAFLIEIHHALSRGESAVASVTNAQRLAIQEGQPARLWAGFQVTGGFNPQEQNRDQD